MEVRGIGHSLDAPMTLNMVPHSFFFLWEFVPIINAFGYKQQRSRYTWAVNKYKCIFLTQQEILKQEAEGDCSGSKISLVLQAQSNSPNLVGLYSLMVHPPPHPTHYVTFKVDKPATGEKLYAPSHQEGKNSPKILAPPAKFILGLNGQNWVTWRLIH